MINLAAFTTIKSIIRQNVDNNCRTDSLIAQLHYKATAALCMICCVIVSSHQYFGTPIDCIQGINGDDAVIAGNVINNYCFVMATYTQRVTSNGHLTHIQRNDPESKLHSYYQWVPIVIFIQAVIFTLPRAVWTQMEGELMSGCLASFDKLNSYPCEQLQHIPSLAKYISRRVHSLKIWGLWNVGHDALNFINVTLNIYLLDVFLGGHFISYGFEASNYLLGYESEVSPLDDTFPKLTKCEFYKYGPSGTLQRHDVMCLMSMNIVNEKIFYILWFWMISLFIITGAFLFLRLLKLLLLSARFRLPTLRRVTSLYDDSRSSRILLDNISLSDIIFLEQLQVNMDRQVFKHLISSITISFNSNIINNVDSEFNFSKFK